MNYHYPNNIEELKDGDEYQIKIPMSSNWSQNKTFSSNICYSKKLNIVYAIEKTNLRIIRK